MTKVEYTIKKTKFTEEYIWYLEVLVPCCDENFNWALYWTIMHEWPLGEKPLQAEIDRVLGVLQMYMGVGARFVAYHQQQMSEGLFEMEKVKK